MGFFSVLKKVAQTTWNILKTIVTPVVIVSGRTVTAMGNSLFGITNAIQTYTKKDNHPVGFYGGIIGAAATFIISLPTRGSAIFRYFRGTHSETPAAQLTAEEEVELGNVGTVISLGLRCISYYTLLSMLTNSYLYSMTLIEFGAELTHTNCHEGSAEYITQGTAILLAACATIAYAIFTLTKSTQNAKYAARRIETWDFPADRYTAGTITLAILAATPIPFTNFFGGMSALNKLPWARDWSTSYKYIYAGSSAFANTVSYSLTQIPPLYTAINPGGNHLVYTHQACWEKPLAVVVYGAGVIDFGTSALSNHNSILQTSNELFGIDPRNLPLLICSIPFAASTALLNYYFSVKQGFGDTIRYYHANRGENAYAEMPSDIENPRPEIEVENDPMGKLPALPTGRGSPTLFRQAEPRENTPLLLPALPTAAKPGINFSGDGTGT